MVTHRKSRLIPIFTKRAVKRDEMHGLQKMCHLFVTSLINLIYRSTTVRFYLLYDPKTTFKSRLEIAWNYALMFPYNHMRNYNDYRRHYIALPKFVNH